ncbi:IclR family transcriptional regulator [Microvirga sp. VF16]|uniref:IclR family transcriptional regulator n=1 Tax=Microvirga sp. VF16 TaxID=2807101 RepID=UPI00193D2018|nr:IclR family transcriptional regulator [Microvirga sp. VF16]QRM32284.1 IclR family transcriptional regulator [Microvirga sp. VF16]
MNSFVPKDSPLERYIAIMEAVAPFAEGLTAAELEMVLDLPKTTVNRLLNVLINSGMIATQNGRNRTFKLGERILKLLHTSPDTGWLVTLAQRPLQLLADRTGQSAFISKFDGKEVRSVTCAAPDTPVRTYVMPGVAMPIHATATGKAIMAFQTPEILKPIFSQQLDQFTEHTKTDPQTLTEELEAVRKRGYALDLAEHVSGLGTIAFPVHLPRTPVIYAVGLTGPYRQVIENNFEAHCEAIGDTAQRLAKLLQIRGAGLHDLSIGSLENIHSG